MTIRATTCPTEFNGWVELLADIEHEEGVVGFFRNLERKIKHEGHEPTDGDRWIALWRARHGVAAYREAITATKEHLDECPGWGLLNEDERNQEGTGGPLQAATDPPGAEG